MLLSGKHWQRCVIIADAVTDWLVRSLVEYAQSFKGISPPPAHHLPPKHFVIFLGKKKYYIRLYFGFPFSLDLIIVLSERIGRWWRHAVLHLLSTPTPTTSLNRLQHKSVNLYLNASEWHSPVFPLRFVCHNLSVALLRSVWYWISIKYNWIKLIDVERAACHPQSGAFVGYPVIQ